MRTGRPPIRTKEYWQEYNRQYRLANKERLSAYHKAWRRAHAHERDSHAENLKYAYGISKAQYNEMLEAQGGVCAVCGDKPRGIRLAVDHDHRTGAVRGLLCIGCNTTVGKLRDSPELIEKIRRYLYRYAQLRLVV